MKFRWKLFLSMMTIVTLAYSISGSLMVTSTFRITYDKEVEFAKEEHEIMQDTLIMVLSHMSSSVTGEIWRQIAKDLDDTSTRESFYFWLGSEDGNEIYQSYSLRKEKIPAYKVEEGEKETGYYLYSDENRYFLMTRSYILTDDGNVYLNIIRDISDVFKNRDDQLWIFYRIMAGVMLFTALFSYVIAYHLTKPLSRLSKVARKISEGDLTIRAGIEANDEIGELAADIDEMAGNLENNIEELNDAVRRQEDFVGNFAHELKTPLTSIIGYADMLRSRKLSQETVFGAANYIFTEGKRLEGMSFKLLELLVTKQQNITLMKIDAEYFFDEIEGALTPVMSKDNINLCVEAEPGFLMADMDLFKSVLFNLADNARKATSGRVNANIEIIGKALKNKYIVYVIDNGSGIPKEEVNKITEAFYMVDKSRAREQGGAGLGLALCKQIMEVHEGTMEIMSKEGEGTTFVLSLKGGAEYE